MNNIRYPAVAGMFYPESPKELEQLIHSLLDNATSNGNSPKAIISPHAGYIYSGSIAASAFKTFESDSQNINHIVLLGPSHRVALRGCALSSADYFRTPLGDIPINYDARKHLLTYDDVQINDAAHAQEHSLEVQLPFLQSLLNDFTLTPIIVGENKMQHTAKILETFWQESNTRFVISSDLSHYHNYQTAQKLDQETNLAILNKQPENIQYDHACGRNPVNGLLSFAKQHDLSVKMLDLRNSGDTAGPKDQVVGYGAWGFY